MQIIILNVEVLRSRFLETSDGRIVITNRGLDFYKKERKGGGEV